jgi:hypothetical protein
MSAAPLTPWAWHERRDAPPPQAAIAWGETIDAMHERLARVPTEKLSKVLLTFNLDVLIAIGATDDLPWVAGVAYAAPSPEAPSLWLPTCWQPDVPCDLLARALTRQYQRQPLLLWRKPFTVLPLDRALPASPALLTRIMAHRQQL